MSIWCRTSDEVEQRLLLLVALFTRKLLSKPSLHRSKPDNVVPEGRKEDGRTEYTEVWKYFERTPIASAYEKSCHPLKTLV
jgi:hypothetical protein